MKDIIDAVRGAPVNEPLVVIIMAARSYAQHAQAIVNALHGFDVATELRVSSGHKTLEHLMTMLRQYDATGRRVVYITVAGRSNAIAGVVDSNTNSPVIACPPSDERLGGIDAVAALRLPTGVGATLVLDPEGAALAAAKILALGDRELSARVTAQLKAARERIVGEDRELRVAGSGPAAESGGGAGGAGGPGGRE